MYRKTTQTRSRLIGACLFMISLFGFQSASAVTLNQLTQQEIEGVLKDLNTGMTSGTATPASALGKTWGFELGVVASLTDSPEIQKYDSSIDQLGNGGFYAQVSFPFGIGLTGYRLSLNSQNDFDYNYNNLGVYWSFGSFVDLGFDLDMKIQYSKTKGDVGVTNTSVINGISQNTTGTYNYSANNLSFYVSKSFLGFVEPFVGINRVSTKDGFNADISANFFDNQITQSFASNGVNQSDTFLAYGVSFYVLHALRLGVEYSSPFNQDKITARIALGI